MRRWPIVAMAAALIAAGAGAGAVNAIRAARVASIAIDGDAADWKDVPATYLDSGPRITAIANDDRFLYVHFRFSDLELARRVLRTGAIVWVNGTGEHETSFGLRYRGTPALEKALEELEGPSDAPPDGPPSWGPRSPRPPLGALEVLHLGAVDEVIASGGKPDGAAAACGMVDGAFAYELRVPLADIDPAAALAGTSATRTIAIGFQMGGVTAAERDAMRERMRSEGGAPDGGGPPGGFSGRRGGPPGGGMPGGGPPGGPEGKTRGPKTVWLDVTLAAASER